MSLIPSESHSFPDDFSRSISRARVLYERSKLIKPKPVTAPKPAAPSRPARPAQPVAVAPVAPKRPTNGSPPNPVANGASTSRPTNGTGSKPATNGSGNANANRVSAAPPPAAPARPVAPAATTNGAPVQKVAANPRPDGNQLKQTVPPAPLPTRTPPVKRTAAAPALPISAPLPSRPSGLAPRKIMQRAAPVAVAPAVATGKPPKCFTPAHGPGQLVRVATKPIANAAPKIPAASVVPVAAHEVFEQGELPMDGAYAAPLRRRRSKMRRFLRYEVPIAVVALFCALLALTRTVTYPPFLIVVNVLTIGCAFAAAIIPICFFALTPTLPRAEE